MSVRNGSSILNLALRKHYVPVLTLSAFIKMLGSLELEIIDNLAGKGADGRATTIYYQINRMCLL